MYTEAKDVADNNDKTLGHRVDNGPDDNVEPDTMADVGGAPCGIEAAKALAAASKPSQHLANEPAEPDRATLTPKERTTMDGNKRFLADLAPRPDGIP